MTRRLAVVALLLAAGLADAQTTDDRRIRRRPRPRPPAVVVQPTPPVVVAAAPETIFLNLLNQARWEAGLRPVVLDPILTHHAALNNAEQARRGLGHWTFPPNWRRQNAAWVSNGVEQAFTLWMVSVPHRVGMLDPSISRIGIAGSGPYWTMNAL